MSPACLRGLRLSHSLMRIIQIYKTLSVIVIKIRKIQRSQTSLIRKQLAILPNRSSFQFKGLRPRRSLHQRPSKLLTFPAQPSSTTPMLGKHDRIQFLTSTQRRLRTFSALRIQQASARKEMALTRFLPHLLYQTQSKRLSQLPTCQQNSLKNPRTRQGRNQIPSHATRFAILRTTEKTSPSRTNRIGHCHFSRSSTD